MGKGKGCLKMTCGITLCGKELLCPIYTAGINNLRIDMDNVFSAKVISPRSKDKDD